MSSQASSASASASAASPSGVPGAAAPPLRALEAGELDFLRSVYPAEADEALVERVRAVHAAALAETSPLHLYRCVRACMYLSPRVTRVPGYAAAVAQGGGGGGGGGGGLWVDVGAGTGTDLRKVIADGWPATAVAAVDVTGELWALGEQLFGAAPCAVTVVDLCAQPPPAALRGTAACASLVSVLHTLDEAGVAALVRGVRALLRPGARVLGSTVGADAPRLWAPPQAAGAPTRFLHSAASLAALLRAAGYADVAVSETDFGGIPRAPGDEREPWQRMLAFEAREPAA